MTADSFVVRPLRFPGGSIGELAVNGTVNDLAVGGARAARAGRHVRARGRAPDATVLEAEVRAMADAAAPRGRRDRRRRHQGRRARQGRRHVHHDDRHRPRRSPASRSTRAPCGRAIAILLSGPIGDHGITILLARGELDLEADLRSDTRSVLPLVEALVAAVGPAIRWMRDPTRGGVATALNELARDCGLGVRLVEDDLPVRDDVRGACELLGLDPLHIANEGQFLAIVAADRADAALARAARAVPGGDEAACHRRGRGRAAPAPWSA